MQSVKTLLVSDKVIPDLTYGVRLGMTRVDRVDSEQEKPA